MSRKLRLCYIFLLMILNHINLFYMFQAVDLINEVNKNEKHKASMIYMYNTSLLHIGHL